MTTHDKKDSVQANDAVAKKPRKPRTKNVGTTVPEVDVTEVNFIGVKHHDLKEFMNSLISVTGKEFVKVSCHSKSDMVDAGYSVITTNVFNKVKDALVNSRDVYYRDVGCPIGNHKDGDHNGNAVDYGIAYISTDKGTHLCFILSTVFDRLLTDKEIVVTINTVVVAVNYPLGNLKEHMAKAFLEQAKNMEPEQKTDTLDDEAKFVTHAINSAKVVASKNTMITEFLKTSITGDLSHTSVHTHSAGVMANNGYNIVITDIFDKVKEAVNASSNGIYRDVGVEFEDGNLGMVYLSDDGDTCMFFLLTENVCKVPENDGNIQQIVHFLASLIGCRVDEIKEKMVSAFLYKHDNGAQQENNATNGVEVMVVEPAKQFHDESQFVLRAVDKGITKNPGLEVVYMQIQGITPNVQYSVMFTNRFDTLVNVLKFGKNTSCTEQRQNSPIPCAMGGVGDYDDSGKYKEYYFFVIGLGDKFSPETFEDNAFLKQTFTHVKWAFASVERYRARRIYEVQDKGDTTMLENQTPYVNELQKQTMDAVMTELDGIFDTPKIHADLKINCDPSLAVQGYNILYTDNFEAVSKTIARLDNLVLLPIPLTDEGCAWKHAAVVVISTKNAGQVAFYVIEEYKNVAGHTNPNLQEYIDAMLGFNDAEHKGVVMTARLEFTKKSEEGNVNAIPKEALDLAKQIEMVDAVMGALGQIESTVPLFEVNLCINRNLDHAEKGYNVLFTNDFKAVINALDNLKEAGQMPINSADFSVAVAAVYVNHQQIQFYVVEELHDIASVPDDDLFTYVTDTLVIGAGTHKKITEVLTQKLGKKFVRRTVQEIDALEAIEDVQKGKVKASDERVTVIRRQVPVEPIANSKQFPPFQGAQRSVGDAGRQGLGRGVVMHQHYGVFGEPPVMEFDNKRYNRHTYPNEVSERFSDMRIYDHTPRYHFGEGSVLTIIRDFMMKHNMPSIPTRDSLDNGEDQFTHELCRLENGSVVWNRAAMLTVPSCRQNKKEGKGINHYMLSVRDDERREFVICIYADYTNRKRPSFVVNYFEILEGDAKPCVGSVVSHLEHVLRN